MRAAGALVVAPALHRGSLKADTAAVQAAAAEFLYGGCPPDRVAWAVGLLRAQAPGCGRALPARQAWRTAASTYVVCARDRALDPELQRAMARRCGTSVTWKTGHAPFVTEPATVVRLMKGLVNP